MEINQERKHMAKQYRLTLGDQADRTLNHIAYEEDTTVSEIMRRAVNVYAALHNYEGVYVKESRQDNKFVIKRIELP
jgi:hypothetical protein